MVTVDLTFAVQKLFDTMGEWSMSSFVFGVVLTVIITALTSRYLCAWIVKHALAKPEIQALVRHVVSEGSVKEEPKKHTVNLNNSNITINSSTAPKNIDGGVVEMPK